LSSRIVGKLGELLVAYECEKRGLISGSFGLILGDLHDAKPKCDLLLNYKLRVEVKTSQISQGRWLWGLLPSQLNKANLLVLVALGRGKPRYFIMRIDAPWLFNRYGDRKASISLPTQHGLNAPIAQQLETSEDNWNLISEILPYLVEEARR
jgi:hypothetical protein